MPAPPIPAQPEPDTLLSTLQAARVVGLDSRTIIRYAERGILPHRRLPSGHRRYRYADVVVLVTEVPA